MNVKLSYLISRATAGIRDIDRDLRVTARRDGLGFNSKVFEAELRVAEAKAKRVNGLAPRKKIAAIPRRLVIVVVRKLTYLWGEADGKFSAGVYIAEENVRGGRSTLLAQVPALQDCRDVLLDVVD